MATEKLPPIAALSPLDDPLLKHEWLAIAWSSEIVPGKLLARRLLGVDVGFAGDQPKASIAGAISVYIGARSCRLAQSVRQQTILAVKQIASFAHTMRGNTRRQGNAPESRHTLV